MSSLRECESDEQLRNNLTNNSVLYLPLRKVNQTVDEAVDRNVIKLSDQDPFVRRLFETPLAAGKEVNPSTSSENSGMSKKRGKPDTPQQQALTHHSQNQNNIT